MNTVTYQSSNANPNERWLAYIVLDNKQLLVRHSGSTEAEAIKNATDWYNGEKQHQNKLIGRVELDSDETSNAPINDGWGIKRQTEWSQMDVKPEIGMVGKVWMINHTEQKRVRANADQVDYYTGIGYVRGGPKTQFAGN